MVLILKRVGKNLDRTDIYNTGKKYQELSARRIQSISIKEGELNLGEQVVNEVMEICKDIKEIRDLFGVELSPEEVDGQIEAIENLLNRLDDNGWKVYPTASVGLYFEDMDGVLFACKTDKTSGEYESIYLFEGSMMDRFEEAILNTLDECQLELSEQLEIELNRLKSIGPQNVYRQMDLF